MKAIVHIGAPKAGSSAIQQFLYLNAGALAARGFHFQRLVEHRGSQLEYPMAALHRVGRLPETQSQRLRYGARSAAEVAAKVGPVLERLKAYPRHWPNSVAVFSSEHILAWLEEPETIAALDGIFTEVFDEVVYVLYLRDPFDQLLSQYSETLKRGESISFQALIDKREDSLLHWTTVSAWESVVGRARLDVRLLDPTFLTAGDLIEDFAAACGFSAEGLTRPGRVNEGLSAAAAEALRMLNARIPGLHPDGGVNPLRRGIVNALLAMDRDGDRLGFTPAQYKSVAERIGESTERLRAERFPERDALFSSEPRVAAGPGDAAIRERALDLMVRLIIDLRLRKIAPLGPKMLKKAVTREPGEHETE